MNVLLVFGSTHGHTWRIARRIARDLRHAGNTVTVRRIDAAPDDLSPFDAVVVGGSLHRGTHQRELVDWAHAHHRALAARPNAFFSVSLSAADDSIEAQIAVRECIDRFVEDTEWDPDVSAPLAGALQYPRYSFPTRLSMHLFMHQTDHPDDITREFEFTDWDAVDHFARTVVHHLERSLLPA